MTGSGGKSGGDASSSMGGLALPADAMDFDGVVEVWYDSIEDIQKSTASERYAEIIRPDEMKLIDAEKCVMYLTEEFIVFDDDNRPAAERKAA
jgi:hypothetical protein